MAEHKEYPAVREIFGSLVFDKRVMKERLNPDVYAQVTDAIEGRQKLDAAAADIIAGAMKDWAIANGATHCSSLRLNSQLRSTKRLRLKTLRATR